MTQTKAPKIKRTSQAPKITETALRNSILDYLSIKGVYAWLNNTQGNYNKRTGRYYKNPRLKAGIADVIGILPNGKLLACEAKTGYNKQTDAQKWHQLEVESNGGIYILAYDLDDVINHPIIKKYADAKGAFKN